MRSRDEAWWTPLQAVMLDGHSSSLDRWLVTGRSNRSTGQQPYALKLQAVGTLREVRHTRA